MIILDRLVFGFMLILIQTFIVMCYQIVLITVFMIVNCLTYLINSIYIDTTST